jgi:molybdate transport system permease protein
VSERLFVPLFSLATAAGATLLILPFGVLTGLWLARWRGPGKALLDTFLSLPLVLPPTAVGLLLLELFGRAGPVGSVLERFGVEVVFTWRGVVLAMAVMSFPLLVRAARSAFEEVDPRMVDVARTLGCGPARAFFRVALPLAGRGILSGAVLAFARALGEFGATILVAGNIPGRTQTLSLAIFQHVQLGEDAQALELVALTTAIAFVVLWLAEALARARPRRAQA